MSDVPLSTSDLPRERAGARGEGWRRRESTVDKDLRASYEREKVMRPVGGWGSTSFPEFPAGPSRIRREIVEDIGEVTERLERMSVGSSRRDATSSRRSMCDIVNPEQSTGRSEDTSRAGSTRRDASSLAQNPSLSKTRSHRLVPTCSTRKVRKKVSSSNFTQPHEARSASPLSPRLRVNATTSPIPSISRSTRHPSKPHSTLPSPCHDTLGSKMASMRIFVSNHLNLATLTRAQSRTLGSELGVELDEWDWDLDTKDVHFVR